MLEEFPSLNIENTTQERKEFGPIFSEEMPFINAEILLQ